jgi:hypothetical protein
MEPGYRNHSSEFHCLNGQRLLSTSSQVDLTKEGLQCIIVLPCQNQRNESGQKKEFTEERNGFFELIQQGALMMVNYSSK